MASQRAMASGSAVCRLAFIGKPVRGRLTVSFHSGIESLFSRVPAHVVKHRAERNLLIVARPYNSLMAAGVEEQAGGASTVHEHVLDNGLRVLIQEVHTAPLATVWAWYRVGSKDEGPGLTGVSHW